MANVLPKALQVNVKLLELVWAWNQKSRHSTALRGQYWAKSMALKLRYVPAIPGPVGAVVTKDWCINLMYRNYAIKVSDAGLGKQCGAISDLRSSLASVYTGPSIKNITCSPTYPLTTILPKTFYGTSGK